MTNSTPRLRTLAAAAALLAVCAEAGGAATLRGTIGPDRLIGTATADAIEGRGGDDFMHGKAGSDRIDAGRGSDRITVHYDGAADRVRCGLGRDIVTADLTDTVAADCEVVSFQLSRDTAGFSFGRVQHETQVEPDSLAVGRTIVTAFQSGRFEDGGAAAVNWATSTDAGRTWRTGFVPNLAAAGTPSGPYDRVSDPVVAYDANRGLWLIASLGLVDREVALLVSRSRDALRWETPIVAATGPSDSLDKEWLVCDSGAASPFRGRCYLAYLDARSGRIAVQHSDDAGATWSAAVEPEAVSALGRIVNGAFPIVRPDGSLVVAFTVFNAFGILGVDDIVSMTSTDGGVTFADPVLVSRAPAGEFYGIRAPLLVSGDVDAGGTVYLAWADCRFRPDCSGSDIVVARSSIPGAWEQPRRVPPGPAGDVDHFIPGLAVQPGTSGTRARLAVVYHSFPQQAGCELELCPGIDVWLARSNDGGRTWSGRRRISSESMPLAWIANTGTGRMLADYVSTSWVAGRPVPVFALATQPTLGLFRQAIFATTRGG
jgi:RTX calcium-binding nonapeptide repeat (4 copies)